MCSSLVVCCVASVTVSVDFALGALYSVCGEELEQRVFVCVCVCVEVTGGHCDQRHCTFIKECYLAHQRERVMANQRLHGEDGERRCVGRV